MRHLGRDEHGTWAGAAVGTRLARPGAAFESGHDWVTCFPDSSPWAASFYDSPQQLIAVYVDVTTVPLWAGATVTMVDLDLDVVLMRDGHLFLDDEEEFDEHRVTLAYPPEVVELAVRTAAELMTAVRDRREPFGDVGATWLTTASR